MGCRRGPPEPIGRVSQTADVVIVGAGIIGGSASPARHGFMHSPAIGILMTEILLDGRAISMDSGALSLDRFATGRLLAEANMF